MTPDEYYRDATKRNIGIVSRAEQDVLRGARVGIVGMGGAAQAGAGASPSSGSDAPAISNWRRGRLTGRP